MGRRIRGLLVYPISVDHPGNQGIVNKMEYQWAAFSELTGKTDLICSSIEGSILNGTPLGEYWRAGRGFHSLNHYAVFYHHVAKHMETVSYDFLYVRYPLALPNFLSFLRRCKNANPDLQIVLEVATFLYRQELQGLKRGILRTFDDAGHMRLQNHVDAIVTFYGQSDISGIPCFQLTNGVDVERIPHRAAPRPDDGFAMIALGSLAERHGIDRVIRGMARYVNQPGSKRITVHVVGDGPATEDPEVSDEATWSGRLRLDPTNDWSSPCSIGRSL